MKRRVQLLKLLAPGFAFSQNTDLCLICFDLKVSPVCCSICKTTYCKYCAQKWKAQGNHKCPTRCSENWQYTPCSPLELKLVCQFGCGMQMIPDQFMKHNQVCEKKPNRKLEDQMKQEYLCSLGHPLKYLSDPQTVPLNIQCAYCQIQKSICRNGCSTCQSNNETYYRYCCQCRHPKGLTKTSCPAGHANFYVKSKLRCFTTTCDMCSCKIKDTGKNCVEDRKCDFAMCADCYEKLEDGEGQKLDLNIVGKPPQQANMFMMQEEESQQIVDDVDSQDEHLQQVQLDMMLHQFFAQNVNALYVDDDEEDEENYLQEFNMEEEQEEQEEEHSHNVEEEDHFASYDEAEDDIDQEDFDI